MKTFFETIGKIIAIIIVAVLIAFSLFTFTNKGYNPISADENADSGHLAPAYAIEVAE